MVYKIINLSEYQSTHVTDVADSRQKNIKDKIHPSAIKNTNTKIIYGDILELVWILIKMLSNAKLWKCSIRGTILTL